MWILLGSCYISWGGSSQLWLYDPSFRFTLFGFASKRTTACNLLTGSVESPRYSVTRTSLLRQVPTSAHLDLHNIKELTSRLHQVPAKAHVNTVIHDLSQIVPQTLLRSRWYLLVVSAEYRTLVWTTANLKCQRFRIVLQNMESTMNLSTWLTDGAVITKLRDTFFNN